MQYGNIKVEFQNAKSNDLQKVLPMLITIFSTFSVSRKLCLATLIIAELLLFHCSLIGFYSPWYESSLLFWYSDK